MTRGVVPKAAFRKIPLGNHPVCSFEGASRYFLDVAATPPDSGHQQTWSIIGLEIGNRTNPVSQTRHPKYPIGQTRALNAVRGRGERRIVTASSRQRVAWAVQSDISGFGFEMQDSCAPQRRRLPVGEGPTLREVGSGS